MCVAAAYLDEVADDYRYRYAVLCGGEAARRALRDTPLDPGDSDVPGPHRRVAIDTYSDYDDFLYRLPKYLADVNRRIDARIAKTKEAEERIHEGRRSPASSRRKASKSMRTVR